MNDFEKRNAGFSGLAGLFSREPTPPDPFGLNAIVDALKQDSVRTRCSWNDRFSHWETAESTTETKAIERARDMVHGVLRENKWLANEGVTLGPQGSFTNRTNVRNEADIDLRVQHPSLRIEYDANVNFQAAYQAGTYFDTGRSFVDLARDMRSWVRGHFLDPEILRRLRYRINTYFRNQVLLELRRGTETSSPEAISGATRNGKRNLPRFTSPQPRSTGKPVLPTSKRKRRRRR